MYQAPLIRKLYEEVLEPSNVVNMLEPSDVGNILELSNVDNMMG